MNIDIVQLAVVLVLLVVGLVAYNRIGHRSQ